MTAQYLHALSLANSVKARRRALRRDLADRELGAADLILGDWPCISTAMVGVVLAWLPTISEAVADRICEVAGVHYGRLFGALTARQRRVLIEAVGEVRPRVLA